MPIAVAPPPLARLQPRLAPVAKAAGDDWLDLLDGIAARFEPRIRGTFLAAVEALRAKVDMDALRAAVDRGSVADVLRIVGLADETGAFDRIMEPLRQALEAGGAAVRQHEAVSTATFAFDRDSPRTIRAMREYGLALIRQITEETRGAVRDVMAEQLTAGINPRAVATRLGDIVGLTSHQAAQVGRYRAALVEGDMKALAMKLRDKRFDASVARAIREGGGVPADKIGQLVGRYAARLRRFRGEMIGRTESIRATNLGAHQGMRQAIEGGHVPEGGLTRRWIVARDERTCPVCKAIARLNAKGVPFEVPFQAPTGTVMRPPAHPNCLPGGTLVAAGTRITGQTERWYDGDAVTISVAGCQDLTLTVNHPVLTARGWVAAGLLNEGDDVIRSAGTDRNPAGMDHHEGVVARIGEIADALRRSGEMPAREVPVAAEDFHGDGVGSEIAVVRAHGLLLGGWQTADGEHVAQGSLKRRGVEAGGLSGLRGGDPTVESDGPAAGCGVCGAHLEGSLLRGHPAPLDALLLGRASDPHAHPLESALDRIPGDAELARELQQGRAGEVVAAKVLRVRRHPFRGHVHNLQTEGGYYLAEGVYVHNCRCVVTFALAVPD